MMQDHPRVCGKDAVRRSCRKPSKGSPPRMRERRIVTRHIVKLHGITPAYAGKTDKVKPTGGDTEDHPRVCGKDSMQTLKRQLA